MFNCDDIVIQKVFELGGCNHQRNGAYKEELSHLPYPYRNFKSGEPIDVVCQAIYIDLGICLSENELLDRLVRYYRRTSRCR